MVAFVSVPSLHDSKFLRVPNYRHFISTYPNLYRDRRPTRLVSSNSCSSCNAQLSTRTSRILWWIRKTRSARRRPRCLPSWGTRSLPCLFLPRSLTTRKQAKFSIHSWIEGDTYGVVPSALAIGGILRPLHGANLAEETAALRPNRRRQRHDHRTRRGYHAEPSVAAITMRRGGIDLHC